MEFLIAALAALIAAVGGWPLVAAVLRIAAKRDGAGAPSPWADRPDTQQVLLRGGLWIGVLERAVMAAGIVLGHPGIVPVVIEIKGLGRIPELRDSAAAGEKFIIGTLASLGWTGLIAALALLWVRVLQPG